MRRRFEVRHGDSLDIMSAIPDRSVGAVISDPPNLNVGLSNDNGNSDPWDDISDLDAATDWATLAMIQFARITRRGGAVVLMAGTHAAAAWMQAADRTGLVWMAELVVLWDYGNTRHNNFGSLNTHILWFSVPGARHAWNSSLRSIYSNVIIARKVALDERVHPTEKPVALTTFLITLLTYAGDLVLDPFCGSGSTLVSAMVAGRKSVGIDRDAACCRIARRRASSWEGEDDGGPIYLWVNGRLEEV